MKQCLMPEWSSVRAVVIAWPYIEGEWGSSFEQINKCYQDILRAFSEEVETWVLVHPLAQTQFEAIRLSLISNSSNCKTIRSIITEYDDTWVRDFGPLSLNTGFLSFQFNGWGNKYPAERDNAINEKLLAHLPSMRVSSLVAEGGALEINDHGILLANKDCLLDKKRNPNLSEQQVLEALAQELGVAEFALIENIALSGDDTDGHIDTLARFVNNHQILYCGINRDHPDCDALESLQSQLQALADKHRWQLAALPTPVVRDDENTRVLAASYANFLICNATIFVPTYDVEEDATALEVFRRVFSSYKIKAVACRALLEQNGSLHCASMQLAAAAWNNQA